MISDGSTILKVRDLKTHFYLDEGVLKAVDGVDIEIERRKTLGVIGESGCGKSVMAFSVMRCASTVARRSLVCPWNSGSRMNTESMQPAPIITSSCVMFAARLPWPARSA